MTWARPTAAAKASAAATPFWKDTTMVPGPTRGAQSRAAASVS